MAKTKISEFSATPANNTDIDSINIAEGCAPSGINDAIRELMAQLKDFQVGSAGDPVTVGGVLTVTAGAVGTPAITTAGDTNTGIFFPAADTIAFSEGGVEAMRLDSSGNLGLGVTPSAWTIKALQVSTTSLSSDSNDAYLTANGFFGGSWKYINTDFATQYYQVNGEHVWRTAPSGTAGNAITFTQAMTLDDSGNLGLGTSSPEAKLQVAGGANPYLVQNSGRAVYGIDIQATAGASGAFGAALSFGAGGTGRAAIAAVQGTADADTAGLAFFTHDSGTSSADAVEAMRITSAGNVGIGNTAPLTYLDVGDATSTATMDSSGSGQFRIRGGSQTLAFAISADTLATIYTNSSVGALAFGTNETERCRIDSSGNLLVGKTSTNTAALGCALTDGDGDVAGYFVCENASGVLLLNRPTSDGTLISFRQAGTQEGTISVSGTTVSYNGGHLSRWAQTTTAKDDTLQKGTVLSNLDEMNVYVAPTTYWTEEDELPEGVSVGDIKVATHPVDNEQLNKVKVSDVEGDANVAGVFVNWTHDEDHNVDEINMAMTGDMIIRIAQGVTVVRGDLLMSAGDGTAKPQGDDIVRSKTVAKVTSNHVTCTYADGSYCVPCVLMAC